MIKMAYIFTKIANSIIMYTKEELPYKVKSYDLKNAVLYIAADEVKNEGIQLDSCEILWPNHYKENDIGLVTKFVEQIVGEGLHQLLSENGRGQPYYYGLGRSRMKESCVKKLRTMVDTMLSKEADMILTKVLANGYDDEDNDSVVSRLSHSDSIVSRLTHSLSRSVTTLHDLSDL